MNLSNLAVRRAVTFSMFYLIIVGAGIFAFFNLKLDLFPELKFPTVAIINTYAGVGPQEIETLVTRPIEMAVASVKNVKKIRSTAKFGSSVTIVELAWGTDIDQAMTDIREKIDLFKNRLPEEARQALIFAFDPSLQPILLVAINGPGDLTQLRDLVERRVAPLIERIPGVASASVAGGQKREIIVSVNPQKLRSYGISMLQIIQALRVNNIQIASGSLDQGSREFTIRTIGMFKNLRQIEQVVVGFKGKPFPQPVHLYQVADVLDTHQKITRAIRSNGKPGLLMLIQKRSDANTVLTAERTVKKLPELAKRLPPGTDLTVMYNQSDIIKLSLANLKNSALQAFFLAVLILLFFLRSFRTSLIIALSIPISIIATFAVMYLADLSLNIISMAGLALAVGMLVDNSIVVLENIFRHFELGKSPVRAAVEGSKEVMMAITASTLTTLAVFVPILFVPGIAGALFKDMVLTICFSLSASLLVAITLIPMMASRILKPKEKNSFDDSAENNKGFIGGLLAGLERVFTKTLNWSLHHRKTTLLLGFSSLGVVMLLGNLIQTEFLPKTDDSMIIARFERAPGTALAETLRTADLMEKIARRHFSKIIKGLLVEAGTGKGFIALFGKGSYAGILRIRLVPLSQRKLRKWDVIKKLREEYAQIPGLKIDFQGFKAAMMSGSGDIDIQIFGYDLEKAKKLAQKIKFEVSKIKGTADVKISLEEGKPELQVLLHRDRIQRLGLTPQIVGATISTAFKGTIATLYRDGGNEYNITVQLGKKYRNNRRALENLFITSSRGKTVTLKNIADVVLSLGPVKIERQDQQRMATVSVNVPGKNLGAILAKVRQVLNEKVTFPPDFFWKIGGSAEDFITSFKWLGIALLASILLVYMVMASQFESLFAPFVILFSVPLSGIGVVLALVLTNSSLSVMALVGLVMLVGIVVNNAIVLIDFIIYLRRDKGMTILEAALESGRVRLRPILMTAATTIFGMIPLALGIGEGAENWAGLGRVVIGGLFSSTFLTLLVVPTLYSSLALTAQSIRRRWFGHKGDAENDESETPHIQAPPTT